MKTGQLKLYVLFTSVEYGECKEIVGIYDDLNLLDQSKKDFISTMGLSKDMHREWTQAVGYEVRVVMLND